MIIPSGTPSGRRLIPKVLEREGCTHPKMSAPTQEHESISEANQYSMRSENVELQEVIMVK